MNFKRIFGAVVALALVVALSFGVQVDSASAGSVSGLQYIHNHTDNGYKYTNTEWHRGDRIVYPHSSYDAENGFAPWCDNADQFPDHHIELDELSPDRSIYNVFYVWQSGDNIYCSTVPGCNRGQANVLLPKTGVSFDITIEKYGLKGSEA